MPHHHPQPTPPGPTARQQRYLRLLAEQTGTSFTPPETRAQASREIERLRGQSKDRRVDQNRDRQAVQADLQAGAGDSVRHQVDETTGYGPSARWTHGTTEAGR